MSNQEKFERCYDYFMRWNKCQAQAIICEQYGDTETAEQYRKKQEEHSKAYWSMREDFRKAGILDEFDRFEDDRL